MLIVHTRPGDFEVDTTDEVLELFHQYPFIANDDFFTVSRDGVDYLEIFTFKNGFTLAYIGPGKDRSRPLPGHYDSSTVIRVLAAYCDGDRMWEKQLATAENFIVPTEVIEESEPLPASHSTEADAFSANAPLSPIQPKGCFSLLVLILIGIGITIQSAF